MLSLRLAEGADIGLTRHHEVTDDGHNNSSITRHLNSGIKTILRRYKVRVTNNTLGN